MLFYGSFGSFGIYSIYQVAKSEFYKKNKSDFYFHKMINDYIKLKKCNLICSNEDDNNYIIQNITQKEDILKFIEPKKIKYNNNCIDYYDDFKRSYQEYKIHKHDPMYYKFGI